MAVSGSKYWSSKREIEMQTNTQSRKHDDAIDWPNGMGFTPCTSAYAAKMRERDAIKAKPEYDYLADQSPDGFIHMDDLSAADYEAWNRLDNELGSMQLDGHLGQSERW